MPMRAPVVGFTLIELSIVLTIIALLAGGILVGQSLIRSSEIQSVITDAQLYARAIENFSQKYGSLPGDMPDAEAYWGSDASCPNTPTNTTPKTATCNGDGNGIFGSYYGPHYERWRAVQQLSNAGFISGKYTGVVGPAGGTDSVPGLNIPESQVEGAGFTIMHFPTFSGDGNFYDGSYGHVILFGSYVSTAANLGAAITPQEAWSIDSKVDDSLPGTGNVRGMKSKVPDCSTTSSTATAAYTLNNAEQACSLIFRVRL